MVDRDRPDDRREMERRETDWLRDEIQQMRLEHREAHQRLRSEMHAEFATMRLEVITKHATTLEDLKARVLVMETERAMDAKHAAKWGMWAGILGAAAISAGIEWIKSFGRAS